MLEHFVCAEIRFQNTDGGLETWVSYLLPVPLRDPALELGRAIRVTTT